MKLGFTWLLGLGALGGMGGAIGAIIRGLGVDTRGAVALSFPDFARCSNTAALCFGFIVNPIFVRYLYNLVV